VRPSERLDQIIPPAPGASEQPPRQIEREDRRIIFANLEEVYLNERDGYSLPWNDTAIAKDLNVPRARVEIVRNENFGPQNSSRARRSSPSPPLLKQRIASLRQRWSTSKRS
jgi:hypothetical protein